RHTRWPRDWSSDVCSSDLPRVAVLWALWVERQYGVKVLGAFVLPVVLVFSLNSATTRSLGIPGIERALGGAWIWVHIGLVLVGRSEERRVGKECRSRGGP